MDEKTKVLLSDIFHHLGNMRSLIQDFLHEDIQDMHKRDEEWNAKIDKALEQYHGGGNGRRLLIQLKTKE
jgi:hypothetical protein